MTGVDSNLADVEIVTDGTIEQLEPLPTARSGGAAFHAPDIGACLTGGEGPERAFTTWSASTRTGTRPRSPS